MFKEIQRNIKAIMNLEYAKAGIYYVIANIVGQGIILFSSGIFTRMMSQDEYGLVSTYATWALILNTFICLNLFITVRNAYIDFKEDYDAYVSSVLLLAILAGISFTIVIVGGCYLMGMDFSLAEVLCACVQSIALNIINLELAVQSMKNQYKQRAWLMVLPNGGHVILSIILMLILAPNLYMAKIFGNAFGLLLFGIGCMVVIFRKNIPKITPKYWKYAFKISLPSIFNTLSDLLLMQCDRLMLTSMVGAAETAEYSIIYNVGSIIVAIYQAINGAWIPWFYKKAAEGNAALIKKIQFYYILGFTLFSCGMMTIAPELIKIISPKNYWSGINYVNLIVGASYLIFLYAFFTAYLLFKKATGKVARNTIIAAVTNLILNYVLIPEWKAYGAALATVVSYLLLFLLHYGSLRKEGRKYFCIRTIWLNMLCLVGYSIVFVFIKDRWFIRYFLYSLLLLLTIQKFKNKVKI